MGLVNTLIYMGACIRQSVPTGTQEELEGDDCLQTISTSSSLPNSLACMAHLYFSPVSTFKNIYYLIY